MKMLSIAAAFVLVACPLFAQDEAARTVTPALAKAALATQSTQQEIYVHRFQHASSGQVAKFVKALFEQQMKNKVALVADQQTNSLLVSAMKSDTKRIKNLLTALDGVLGSSVEKMRTSAPKYKPSDPTLENIPLRHATAIRILPVIENLVAPFTTGKLRMVADPRTNSILLMGNDADRQRIKQLIATLDVEIPRPAPKPIPSGPAPQFTRIPLEHVDANTAENLAKSLVSLLVNNRYKIVADRRTNALLVVATPDDLATIKDVLAEVDRKQQ